MGRLRTSNVVARPQIWQSCSTLANLHYSMCSMMSRGCLSRCCGEEISCLFCRHSTHSKNANVCPFPPHARSICSIRVRTPTVNEQGIYKVSCSIIVFTTLIILWFCELSFPPVVGLVTVQIWKHQIKHIRVPFCWMSFDTLLYVLWQL